MVTPARLPGHTRRQQIVIRHRPKCTCEVIHHQSRLRAPGAAYRCVCPMLTCCRSEGDRSPGKALIHDSPSESISDEEHMELDCSEKDSVSCSGGGDSPRASTTTFLGRLSLEQARGNTSPQSRQQRGILTASGHGPKRRASVELHRLDGRRSPRCHDGMPNTAAVRNVGVSLKHQRRSPSDRHHFSRAAAGDGIRRRMLEAHCHVRSHDKRKETPVRNDSGYVSHPSEMNTSSCTHGSALPPGASVSQGIAESGGQLHSKGLIQLPANGRYPGLILQPDSSHISQDQLAAEVKGIYAGLVMVEAKCINIDAAQAADPNSQLGAEQWQALIALHRTLLYEHHDFLMVRLLNLVVAR